MEEADEIRIRLGLDDVSAICVLAATVKVNVGFSTQELKSLPLREHEILNFYSGSTNSTSQEQELLKNIDNPNPATPALSAYCINRTEQAKDGKLEPIIGRDREIRMLTEILCRRTKPNFIIVGEPGVGKTALVEGFATELAEGHIPSLLKNAALLELDNSALMTGASYKGEVEDRLKKVIKECKNIGKTILFIDEIHTLIDPKGQEHYKLPFSPKAAMMSSGTLETCDIAESIAQNIMLLIITKQGENRYDEQYGNDVWNVEFDNGVTPASGKISLSAAYNARFATMNPA